ncbi:MAG: hypothetical protein AAF637_24895, partial [Pseudomonadota bacterium]
VDDDYYEDLDGEKTKAIIEALKRGERPKPASQTGRQGSMPVGGRTTLVGPAPYKQADDGGSPDIEAKQGGQPEGGA